MKAAEVGPLPSLVIDELMRAQRSRTKGEHRIAAVVGNDRLASAIYGSIRVALDSPFVHLNAQAKAWQVFESSLKAAIRDIETDPRGKLFRRLIEFGPHHPDDPKAETSDGETVLSDPECGKAVTFIFSHMVNRFKGELAELLALEPCIRLIEQQKSNGSLPADIRLHWGGAVEERRWLGTEGHGCWGGFCKGADGLITRTASDEIDACGIVEVKSMQQSQRRLLNQIGHHIRRLKGGVRLSGAETDHRKIVVRPDVLRIMVIPSTWKLSRDFRWEEGEHGGRKMVFTPSAPPDAAAPESVGHAAWRITLNWSQEALEQAAYEMTFGYMAEVGRHVFTGKSLPKGWEGFTPEEAGYNAIKMMLYYMPLRYLSARHARLAIKLYNVYSFGYPIGVDSKEMIWPEDLG